MFNLNVTFVVFRWLLQAISNPTMFDSFCGFSSGEIVRSTLKNQQAN